MRRRPRVHPPPAGAIGAPWRSDRRFEGPDGPLASTRRAAGGAAIALPALEIMFDRHRKPYAQATTIPKRYVVCFGGQSLGGDGDPLHNDYVPNTVGANYDLKSALAPLAPVQADVSVVSGISDPDRERRHRPRGRPARRLPRLVAEPAAVGRPFADEHRVGRADVRSGRRRRHRRHHAVQVAGLPGPGGVVPVRLRAVRSRHDLVQGEPVGRQPAGDPSRWSARRWRSTPCSTTSRRPTTRRPPPRQDFLLRSAQERARPGQRKSPEADGEPAARHRRPAAPVAPLR